MKISWILIISILINWGVVMADTAEILPGSGPGSYEIKSDTSEVRLNFEYFGENILIRGKMQGKEVKFLIDNGSLWDQVWFYAGLVCEIEWKSLLFPDLSAIHTKCLL